MSARSASSAGSPTYMYQVPARNGFQYSGKLSISVTRLDGPTMSTPQAKVSGVKLTPISVVLATPDGRLMVPAKLFNEEATTLVLPRQDDD